MKLLINGAPARSLSHFLGATQTFRVQLINDDGSPVSLASPVSCVLEVFTTSARTDTPTKTITVTPTPGLESKGFGSFTLEPAEAVLVRAVSYYLWAKVTDGAIVTVGTLPCTLLLK